MEKGATLTLSLPCSNNKKIPMLLERNDNGGVLHNGMSLFQDLKLKRRKVDSRCSSDGESIGTSESTSSLSPDAPHQNGEGSPKGDKERCITPEEPLQKSAGFPSLFFLSGKGGVGGGATNTATNPSTTTFSTQGKPPPPTTKTTVTTTANVVVVKSEPPCDDSTPSSSPGLPEEQRKSDSDPRPKEMKSTAYNSSNSSSDNESLNSTSSSIKGEKSPLEGEKLAPLASPRSNLSSSGSLSSSPRRSPSSLVISNLTVSMASKPPSQRASPIHGNGSRGASPPQQQQQQLFHGNPHVTLLGPGGFHNHLHARLTADRERDRTPKPLEDKEPPPLTVSTSTSLSFHHQQQQQQQHHHQTSSMYRINGVRPEVISGGAVTPPGGQTPSNGHNHPHYMAAAHPHMNGGGFIPPPFGQHHPPHHHHHQQQLHPGGGGSPRKSPSQSSRSSSNSSPASSMQHSPGAIIAGGNIGMGGQGPPNGPSVSSSNNNLSRTPTVIMGEAGGVRTMLWSQPGQGIPNPASLEIGIGGSSPGSGSLSSGSGSSSSGNFAGGGGGGKGSLSMERLWASEALNLSTGASNTTNGGHSGQPPPLTPLNGQGANADDDEYEQPMICMICEDRATGLHYGIITCEGCKGFFKRTVQNRRVYTCVADGTCEITKAQRNRCQYCRFKKCIEQGMVLQAVREDRMPGGRNSGAVYNLYKVPVKYRKHKKGGRGAANGAAGGGPTANGKLDKGVNGVVATSRESPGSGHSGPMPPTHHPGNILMAALTSPSETLARRQNMPFDQAANMINALVQCDNFHDIAALHNWEELLEARGELSEKLCQMGDSIVYRLVQWTKRLPFYGELPVEVHTRVLTHKWHELLVLTTSSWHAMHTPPPSQELSGEEETLENLQVLQRCLQAMMGRSLTLEQLRQDVGQMVERLTHLTRTFRRLGIRIEEYVSLKVIAMLQNPGSKVNEVSQIQDRYVKVLRTFLEMTVPSQPNRLTELLRCLPEVQAAASLLLESKMFYVPFLLNSALLQR